MLCDTFCSYHIFYSLYNNILRILHFTYVKNVFNWDYYLTFFNLDFCNSFLRATSCFLCCSLAFCTNNLSPTATVVSLYEICVVTYCRLLLRRIAVTAIMVDAVQAHTTATQKAMRCSIVITSSFQR